LCGKPGDIIKAGELLYKIVPKALSFEEYQLIRLEFERDKLDILKYELLINDIETQISSLETDLERARRGTQTQEVLRLNGQINSFNNQIEQYQIDIRLTQNTINYLSQSTAESDDDYQAKQLEIQAGNLQIQRLGVLINDAETQIGILQTQRSQEIIRNQTKLADNISNQIDLLNLQIEQYEIDKKIKKNRLKQAEQALTRVPNRVYATVDSVILNQSSETGSYIYTFTRVLEIGEINKRYSVEIILPTEAYRLFHDGNYPKLNVSIPVAGQWNMEAELVSLRREPGNLVAVIDFDADSLIGGELVRVTISTSYVSDFILPNSAIKVDENGNNYVLMVERRRSSIGYEYVLFKHRIFIHDFDIRNTAIEDIWLHDVPIVIESDRFVFENMRVRLADGGDFIGSR
jgi:hypothetical protein